MNFQPKKGHPRYRNLNKMKCQRNIWQVKEHDKCPPNQTKEEGIGSLPEKEFRIMIVQMIQNLANKMELQINRLETRIDGPTELPAPQVLAHTAPLTQPVVAICCPEMYFWSFLTP